MKTRRLVITGFALLVCLATGLWPARPGRTLRGISTVAIRNDSDAPLTNVTVTVAHGGRSSTLTLPREVAAHESLRLPFPQRSLTLVGATFSWRGRHIGHDSGPIESGKGEPIRAGQ